MAFIFNPEENEAPRRERPPKRRKTAKRASATENEAGQDEENSPLWFTPLLSGAEGMACVRRRERLLEEKWAVIDARIKVLCIISTDMARISLLMRWVGYFERLQLCDSGRRVAICD